MNYPEWVQLLMEKAGKAEFHSDEVKFLKVSKIAMDVFDLRKKKGK